MMKKSNWVTCDSRSDLTARLSNIDSQVFDELKADDGSSYGYLSFNENKMCIPVFFSDVGLIPQSISCDDVIFVGITDDVVGYDLKTGRQIFTYRMPTVFHAFVAVHGEDIVVQDETGFVVLSMNGEEKGVKLYSDVIDSYEINENIISGETMDGELFNFPLIDLL